jgi:hypothetical protein
MWGDPLKNYVFIMTVLLVFALGLLAYLIWSSWGEATVSLILGAQYFAQFSVSSRTHGCDRSLLLRKGVGPPP